MNPLYLLFVADAVIIILLIVKTIEVIKHG